jgi:hypothetical protein
MIGRMLPGEDTKTTGPKAAQPVSAQPLLMLHSANMESHPQYALQAIGAFPYVKLVPISARAVPVPMEIMGLPSEENASLGAGSQFLVHRAQSSAPSQDIAAKFLSSCGCASCSCGSCSCFDCSSCSCSSCTCA